MNPDLYDIWDDWPILRDWIDEIWDMFARIRTLCGWQATQVITATAMAEDDERPKEKPRPPAGGKKSFHSKPELVPILVAVKAQ